MPVFLPVAGLSINAFLLVAAGAAVGFLSGLLGVGGGFLLTPILMMIGIPPTIAAASDTNAVVATSSSGVGVHLRLGNVDIKMGFILLLGGLTGAAAGVEVIKVIRAFGNADVLIKLTYIVVLGTIGGFMFAESMRQLRHGGVMVKPQKPRRTWEFLSKLPFQMTFPRSHVRHSVLVPFFVCALVGVLAAIMGVGGGFLLVPMMVYLLGMPVHVAVGTSLFQILFTGAGVTLMQATTNQTVDIVLALLLAAGSTIGAQVGAIVGRLLRGEQLMILLATLALAVVGNMCVALVLAPSNLLDMRHGMAQLDGTVQVPADHPPPPSAGGGGMLVHITPGRIDIGATYSGANMRIDGVAAPRSEVIVVARGPESEEVFKRKKRVGPIWLTTERVHISGAPSLFLRYGGKPVESVLSRDQIDRFQLDTAAIRDQMHLTPADPEEQLLRRHYIQLRQEERVYRAVNGAVARGPAAEGAAPYSVAFHWPRHAPPQHYEIRVYECRNGVVTRSASAPLEVVETGFPSAVTGLMLSSPLWYGVLAVLIAALSGFGIDFAAARITRRLRPAGVRLTAGAAGDGSEATLAKHSH